MISIATAWIIFLSLLWLPAYIYRLYFPSTVDSQTHTLLEAEFGRVTLRTTVLSHFFLYIGRRFKSFWNSWFRIGFFCSLLCGIICFFYLLYNVWSVILFPIFNLIFSTTDSSSSTDSASAALDSVSLVIVIPGLNVPFAHLPFILIALLSSAIVHEFGHATCASSEQCNVDEVGFMFYFCLPSAYVSLNSEHIETKSTSAKLKIFSAGVWHNVILSILVVIVLYLVIPVNDGSRYNPLLFHRNEKGVYAWPADFTVHELNTGQYALADTLFTESVANAATNTVKQLPITITHLNDCKLENATSWEYCVMQIYSEEKKGYAIPSEKWKQVTENQKCCTEDDPYALCVLNNSDETSTEKQQGCIKARELLKYERCNPIQYENNSNGEKCVQPRECAQDKFTKLVQIYSVKNEYATSSSGGSISSSPSSSTSSTMPDLFLGDIRFFIHQVKVSSVYLNFPFSYLISLSSIELLASTLHYIFAFSTALAMLNMLPVPYLDGQYIVQALVEEVSQEQLQYKKEKKMNSNGGNVALVFTILKYTSIVLLVANIGIALFKSIKMFL